jgi:hypothetical protein
MGVSIPAAVWLANIAIKGTAINNVHFWESYKSYIYTEKPVFTVLSHVVPQFICLTEWGSLQKKVKLSNDLFLIF